MVALDSCSMQTSPVEQENAINDYTKAIQIDRDHAKAYYNRGNSYRNLGQVQAAAADRGKACSLDSQHC
jgi:tetratricopeptide (TPR) repeat protein